MYIYPDNLKSKATLWLWQLKDIFIIGISLLLSILALFGLGFVPPIVITAVYAFLTIRADDKTILDFIKWSVSFFITTKQFYLGGETTEKSKNNNRCTLNK